MAENQLQLAEAADNEGQVWTQALAKAKSRSKSSFMTMISVLSKKFTAEQLILTLTKSR